MKVGIVGGEAAKWTPDRVPEIKALIRTLLSPGDVLVSGGCHLGGVDIWAEDVAAELGLATSIHKPTRLAWIGGEGHIGYRERNIRIATESDILHNIVALNYPQGFTGMRFVCCYHCGATSHIKSGGCWTAKHVQHLGKPAVWWEV